MNKPIKQSKIPTLPIHKNVCLEERCITWTFPLSIHDEYKGEIENGAVYKRTIKWKCENGHRVNTEFLVDEDKKFLKAKE